MFLCLTSLIPLLMFVCVNHTSLSNLTFLYGRGTPKRRAKKTKCAQSSIMHMEEDAPPANMYFPPRFAIVYFLLWLIHTIDDSKFLRSQPSQTPETTTKKRENMLNPLMKHLIGNCCYYSFYHEG